MPLLDLVDLQRQLTEALATKMARAKHLLGILELFKQSGSSQSSELINELSSTVRESLKNKGLHVTDREIRRALELIIRTAITVPKTKSGPDWPLGFERFFENLVILLLVFPEKFYYFVHLNALKLKARLKAMSSCLSELLSLIDELEEATAGSLFESKYIFEAEEALKGVYSAPGDISVDEFNSRLDAIFNNLMDTHQSIYGVFARIQAYINYYRALWRDYVWYRDGFKSAFDGWDNINFIRRASALILTRMSVLMKKLRDDVKSKAVRHKTRHYLKLITSGKEVTNYLKFPQKPYGTLAIDGVGDVSVEGDDSGKILIKSITYNGESTVNFPSLSDYLTGSDYRIAYSMMPADSDGFTCGSFPVTEIGSNYVIFTPAEGSGVTVVPRENARFFIFSSGSDYYGHYLVIKDVLPQEPLGGSAGIHKELNKLLMSKINDIKNGTSTFDKTTLVTIIQEHKNGVDKALSELEGETSEDGVILSGFLLPEESFATEIVEYLRNNSLNRGLDFMLSCRFASFFSSSWMAVGPLDKTLDIMLKR